ncbi:unnamed protein product [Enterobius vermicularis]|uniref:ANF_receptor domain-containing protein n=1 Tax=Enterobius vermicularis TaxID=51028 RepID=A0A0N4UUI3_ENTVE|nr:unnamed protein product [Enterobius vermicularis]
MAECDIARALLSAVELTRIVHVHAIFGPSCILSARAVGIFGGSLDLPIILWGMTTSIEFKDDSRYPTTVSAVGNSEHLAIAMNYVVEEYGWTNLATIFGDDELAKCLTLLTDMEVSC